MTVLVVENDSYVAALVGEVLVDAGYSPVVLPIAVPAAVRAVVDCVEPDCVLLDGGGRDGYSTSWTIAAWLQHRPRPVPAVMFTVDADAVAEAQARTTERSRHFAAILAKPFDLDDLVATVARVVGPGQSIRNGPISAA